MRYKKNVDKALDEAFKASTKHGFNIRFANDVLFYKKGFHWEYLKRENVAKLHRRVEEVISHTSCCAENMDIQKFIVTLDNQEVVTVHVCDGEPRLAEKLYNDVKEAWPEVEYGKS